MTKKIFISEQNSETYWAIGRELVTDFVTALVELVKILMMQMPEIVQIKIENANTPYR